MSASQEILSQHVRLFNEGVRNGNFGPMMSLFSENAEMRFEGIPVGPFKGRTAIMQAYAMQPPDDQIVLLSSRRKADENEIIGEYAWLKDPTVRAGELRITAAGGKIVKLTIHYKRT